MTAAAPYPGLRPFEPDEVDVFFGREEQIDQVLGRLDRSRLLAVVGLSGCGKSSLVKAGLVPALQTGFLTSAGARWRIADPLQFLRSVRDEIGARTRLDDILDSATRDVVSGTELEEIVRSADWQVDVSDAFGRRLGRGSSEAHCGPSCVEKPSTACSAKSRNVPIRSGNVKGMTAAKPKSHR